MFFQRISSEKPGLSSSVTKNFCHTIIFPIETNAFCGLSSAAVSSVQLNENAFDVAALSCRTLQQILICMCKCWWITGGIWNILQSPQWRDIQIVMCRMV